jgi:hypothetical protein
VIVDFEKGQTFPIEGRLLLLPRNMIGPNEDMISNEHKNIHFDSEQDIHSSSKNHEESGYGVDHPLVSNPLRSGGLGKSNHSRAIHLSSRASPKGPLLASLRAFRRSPLQFYIHGRGG